MAADSSDGGTGNTPPVSAPPQGNSWLARWTSSTWRFLAAAVMVGYAEEELLAV